MQVSFYVNKFIIVTTGHETIHQENGLLKGIASALKNMIIKFIRPWPFLATTFMVVSTITKVVSLSKLGYFVAEVTYKKVKDIQTLACYVTLNIPGGTFSLLSWEVVVSNREYGC